MVNLLSHNELKRRRTDYMLRMFIALSLASSIACALGFLVLLPVYLQYSSERIGISAEVDVLSQSVYAQQARDERDELIAARKRIESLEESFAHEGASEKILRAVTEHSPAGAYITAIEYIMADGGITTRISGLANERAILQKYVLSLEVDPLFSSVSVPVSSLSFDKNTFVITAKSEI